MTASIGSPGPLRRATHACSQCRERKQKCGGFTAQVTCATCLDRKVRCSFESEFMDPRYNPYLRIQTPIHPRSDSSPQAGGESADHNLVSTTAGRSTPNLSSPPELRAQQIPSTNNVQSTHILENVQSQLQGLQSRLHKMEQSFLIQANNRNYVTSPNVDPMPSYSIHRGTTPVQQNPTPPSSSSTFDGPLRVLHGLNADDPFDTDNHDPITRGILTYGEASVAFKIYFNQCHPHAPFLDSQFDRDMDYVRLTNLTLFLNILVVGARFWGQSDKKDLWLHPRYRALVILLDNELNRIILRPKPSDLCLATVQALMIYSHWMPIDVSSDGTRIRSRFSESSAWHCMGMAIRWATLLGFDRTAHLPFSGSPSQATEQDVRIFRTMLYLTESDHYLAFSARRTPTLPTEALCQALPRFLRNAHGNQATDPRLTSLLRVVHAAHMLGDRATSSGSVDAFNEDINLIEREFTISMAHSFPTYDRMSQHFPFTSLTWYRLVFASTSLPPAHEWRQAGEVFNSSVGWAKQILTHLSPSAPMESVSCASEPLIPDPGLVELLSFAIDQYFVVISYTASFLVLAWQTGAINNQLQVMSSFQTEPTLSNVAPQSSLLYRLVDLAARTLASCAPSQGHLATRFTVLLRSMANKVETAVPDQLVLGDQIQTSNEAVQAWDQDWQELWRSMGVEPGWIFNTSD